MPAPGRTPLGGATLPASMDKIDAEWRDICDAIYYSGLATWQDWIELGIPERLC
jgi:hypothetical protein